MRLRRLAIVAVLALAAPPAALARGTFDPTTEFEQHEWIPIHLGPLNMSVTKEAAGPSPDAGGADLRGRTDAGRGAGAAVKGDRALVSVRGHSDAVHLGRQHARLHPAAGYG
jgi:hypothetical protein